MSKVIKQSLKHRHRATDNVHTSTHIQQYIYRRSPPDDTLLLGRSTIDAASLPVFSLLASECTPTLVRPRLQLLHRAQPTANACQTPSTPADTSLPHHTWTRIHVPGSIRLANSAHNGPHPAAKDAFVIQHTMQAKQLPKPSELRAFDMAVAGQCVLSSLTPFSPKMDMTNFSSAGTMCDTEGMLFIKPCVQAEIDFYQEARDKHSELADIMPLFMGSLMLSDAADPPDASSIAEQVPAVAGAVPAEVKEALAGLAPSSAVPSTTATAAPATDNETWVRRGSRSINTDRAVVLENTTHGFKKPNVLDVKLGHRRLWGDSAPLQKRRRMDEICSQTTHGQYGFRIAGMRVFRGSADPAELDAADYRVYDKDYGRSEAAARDIVGAFRNFLFNPAAGIDADHARAVAQAFKADLERVRDVLERERTRMYSSSLLFVFEGDGATLRAAIAEANASAAAREEREQSHQERKRKQHTAPASASAQPVVVARPEGSVAEEDAAAARSRSRREALGKATDRSSSRTDSGIGMDDRDGHKAVASSSDNDDEAYASYSEVDDFDVDEDEDENEDSDGDDADAAPRIYGTRLIDFAHAKFVAPDEGPDENNLDGVRNLIKIFDELSK